MGAKDSHGVVVVRVSRSTIHRPQPRGSHGIGAMMPDDWELFPNLDTAREAGFTPCKLCFYQELQPDNDG